MNKILCGDCVELLASLPEESVDLVVTSPPYDDIRFYADGFVAEFGKTVEDFEDEKEYKKEFSKFKRERLKEKLEQNNGYSFPFQQIAQQLKRCLKPGGTVVWVVGDAVVKGGETGSSFRQALYFQEIGFKIHDTMIYEKNGSSFPARQDGNRYSQIFEYMFVFTKDGAPRHAKLICDKLNRWAGYTTFGKGSMRGQDGELQERTIKPVPDFSPRNNIWKYNTGKGFSTKDKEAFEHPAIFPEKLAEDHILSWSKPGDVVLDPFNGSGTTCKMAYLNGRQYIGIDISEKYCGIAERRLEKAKEEGKDTSFLRDARSVAKLKEEVDSVLERGDEKEIETIIKGFNFGSAVDYVPDQKKSQDSKNVAILKKVGFLLEKEIQLIKKGSEEEDGKV
jgi:site-specific DNA-methyltransferase (adenine-specific)